MDIWRLKEFEQLVGKTLKAVELDTDREIKVKISELITSNTDEGWESFSVIMSCTESLNQGRFKFFYKPLGSTVLFASPNSDVEIEAVISLKC